MESDTVTFFSSYWLPVSLVHSQWFIKGRRNRSICLHLQKNSIFFNILILQALVGTEFDVLCQTDSFYEFCIFVSPIGQRCEFEWRRKVCSCFFVFSIQCNSFHPFCRSGISAAAIALSWNCVQVSWERTTSTNVGSESGMPGQVTPGYGAVKWNRISLVEVGAPGLLCEEELRYVASLLWPIERLNRVAKTCQLCQPVGAIFSGRC